MVTTRVLLVFVALVMTACGQSTIEQSAEFDRLQIAGWWVESADASEACDHSKVRMKYTLSSERNRLFVRFDRKWRTDEGEVEAIEAAVLDGSRRTLTLRYPGEKRMNASGNPVLWEMVFVAPGVYRWREATWAPGRVNEIVGVRCSM